MTSIAMEIGIALSCGAAVAAASYGIGISVLPGAVIAPLLYLYLQSR